MISNSVKVEKIVNGGYGLARESDGRVILLRNALPQEELSYSVEDERSQVAFGLAHAILSPSIHRVPAPCPHYAICGGCNLQHCTYPEQLNIKTAIVNELIKERPELNCPALPAIPSPTAFGYRQRIRLQVAQAQVGFFRHRSNSIVPLSCCLLAHGRINEVLCRLAESSSFPRLLRHCREIELLFNPATLSVAAVFHLERKMRPADKQDGHNLVQETEHLDRLFFTGRDFALTGPFGEKNPTLCLGQSLALAFLEAPIQLQWEVGGFCQVNWQQNNSMINFVLEHAKTTSQSEVLDLFCGMGNFAIPLAFQAKSVTGIEGQASSIRMAKENSRKAELGNTSFIKGNSFELTKQLAREDRRYEVVLVDPPRQGIAQLIHSLVKIAADQIIYISCDPATLVRDLALLRHHGFRAQKIQPFDMFPQTHHIESVTLLEKH